MRACAVGKRNEKTPNKTQQLTRTSSAPQGKDKNNMITNIYKTKVIHERKKANTPSYPEVRTKHHQTIQTPLVSRNLETRMLPIPPSRCAVDMTVPAAFSQQSF